LASALAKGGPGHESAVGLALEAIAIGARSVELSTSGHVPYAASNPVGAVLSEVSLLFDIDSRSHESKVCRRLHSHAKEGWNQQHHGDAQQCSVSRSRPPSVSWAQSVLGCAKA
jgi:hypothetical protein